MILSEYKFGGEKNYFLTIKMRALISFATFLLCFIFVQCEETYNCSQWRKTLDKHGQVVFIAGDREYVVPKTLQGIEQNYCRRQLEALEEIRLLGRHCLKPFPKQIIGLATYGARKETKAFCKNGDKQEFLKMSVCFRNSSNYEHLHKTMDDFTVKIETIRDHVTDDSLKLPYLCCYQNEYLDIVEREFLTRCQDKSTPKYWTNLNEKRVEDAVDLMCHTMRRGSQKCKEIFSETPLIVPANAVKQSKSVLVPMVDILTQLGALPDL